MVNRQFRKQLRIWKNDFDNVWSRLTSFHRAALGIIIAMIIVALLRIFVTDDLKEALSDKQKEIESKGVPSVVATPQKDNEIIELKMQRQGLEETLKEAKAAEAELIRRLAPLQREEKNLAINETDRIISRSGLRVVSREELELPAEENDDLGGMSTSLHQYVLAGNFNEVQRFFQNITKFPWPYRLENISISTANEGEVNFGEFDRLYVLQLSFTQTLFYYDYANLK